jgi:carboxypeptidase C (cathepsin A)
VGQLSDVIKSGVRTLIWAGDADWICNHMGVEAVLQELSFPGFTKFNSTALAPLTANGTAVGMYKTTDNLSYIKVYGAGHEVPYYQPQLALQSFVQTMQGKPISST